MNTWLMDDPISQVEHELLSHLSGSFANRESRDQFGVFIEGNENELIANGYVVLAVERNVCLLGTDECPDSV
jgi:hypothetical protein